MLGYSWADNAKCLASMRAREDSLRFLNFDCTHAEEDFVIVLNELNDVDFIDVLLL